MSPLHTSVLYPVGRISHKACMQVERRTYTHHQLGIEAVEVIRHEPFLLGSAQSYPENIGFYCAYLFAQLTVLIEVQWMEGWSVGPHNLDPRKSRFQIALELFRNAGTTTVQEMRVAPFQGLAAHVEHKIGSEDPAYLPVAFQFAYPDHWHSIRSGQQGFVQDPAKTRIMLRFH